MSAPAVIIASINGVDAGRKVGAPRLPEEIADTAIACLRAGASVIHSHAHEVRVTGAASAACYLEGWRPVLARRPEALFYPTVNWAPDGRIVYDHLQPLAESGGLRIGLNDVGSICVGTLVDGVPRGAGCYANSFDETIERFALCARLGLGVATQIFEPSALRTVVRLWKKGLVPKGAFLNLYFYAEPAGAPPHRGFYGLPPTPTALACYLEILGDCPLPWAAAVWGDDLSRYPSFVGAVAGAGGHVNVGLELHGGAQGRTNAGLVRDAVGLLAAHGRRPASCGEAAAILGLP